jgi:hypothetical protein
MTTLYKTNMLSWISIVLGHWNKSTERHVSHIGHIFRIPSQPVFDLIPKQYVIIEETTKTNVIVYGLTRPGVQSTIYRTHCKHANHYTTDAAVIITKYLLIIWKTVWIIISYWESWSNNYSLLRELIKYLLIMERPNRIVINYWESWLNSQYVWRELIEESSIIERADRIVMNYWQSWMKNH